MRRLEARVAQRIRRDIYRRRLTALVQRCERLHRSACDAGDEPAAANAQDRLAAAQRRLALFEARDQVLRQVAERQDEALWRALVEI